MSDPDLHVEPAPPDPPEDPPLDVDQLIYWVHCTLLPLVERRPGQVAWCPRWWEHAEALFRCELMRRAWEAAVASDEAQALSEWQLHCADAHLRELLSPTGPFGECAWSDRRGWAREHQPRGLPAEWPADFDLGRFPAAHHYMTSQQ